MEPFPAKRTNDEHFVRNEAEPVCHLHCWLWSCELATCMQQWNNSPALLALHICNIELHFQRVSAISGSREWVIASHGDTTYYFSKCADWAKSWQEELYAKYESEVSDVPFKEEIPYTHFACKNVSLMTSCNIGGEAPRWDQFIRRVSRNHILRWKIKQYSWMSFCLLRPPLRKQCGHMRWDGPGHGVDLCVVMTRSWCRPVRGEVPVMV
jgi:hypothetical protein